MSHEALNALSTGPTPQGPRRLEPRPIDGYRAKEATLLRFSLHSSEGTTGTYLISSLCLVTWNPSKIRGKVNERDKQNCGFCLKYYVVTHLRGDTRFRCNVMCGSWVAVSFVFLSVYQQPNRAGNAYCFIWMIYSYTDLFLLHWFMICFGGGFYMFVILESRFLYKQSLDV